MDSDILPRVLHTLLSMLRKRGYSVPPQREMPTNKHGLVMREKLSFTAEKEDEDTVRVHFVDEPKIMSKDVEVASEKALKLGSRHVIIVAETVVMVHINKQIATQVNKHDMQVEVFSFADLMMDITEHELVPPHIMLSEQEKQEVLRRFCTSESKIPKLLQTDPVAKFYNMQPGQMVKIIRKSPTRDSAEYYRVVVQNVN